MNMAAHSIADDGVAKQFEATFIAKHKATISTPGGSRSWMAPEMLKASMSPDIKIPNTFLNWMFLA